MLARLGREPSDFTAINLESRVFHDEAVTTQLRVPYGE